MDLFDAIHQRYSYRGPFEDRKAPRQDLEKIVRAGLAAPSGKNAQTTTFVIIDDEELLRKIGVLHRSNTAMQQAKAMIACIVDSNPQPVYENCSFQVEDCAAAVQNMLLAITALGYASVWIDGWLRVQQHAETIGRLLELPEGKIVRILLPLGVPAESGPRKEKKDFAERAWFNRYTQVT